MAKATATRGPGGAIIISTPAAPARRRASAVARAVGAKAKHHARRIGSATAKRAWQKRALISGAVVGYGMGYIIRENINLPSVGPLGKNGTVAAALTALSLIMPGNEWLGHAAAAAISIAAYDYATTGSVHGVGNGGRGGAFDHIHRAIDGR